MECKLKKYGVDNATTYDDEARGYRMLGAMWTRQLRGRRPTGRLARRGSTRVVSDRPEAQRHHQAPIVERPRQPSQGESKSSCSIAERKKTTTCAVCGQVGHWKGDQECSDGKTKKQSHDRRQNQVHLNRATKTGAVDEQPAAASSALASTIASDHADHAPISIFA